MKRKFITLLLIYFCLTTNINSSDLSISLKSLSTIRKHHKNLKNQKDKTQSSFLSLNTKTALKDKASVSEMTHLKEMLLSTSSSRKKKRFTHDGRLCASAFVQNGQTFFDCTNSKSPDGHDSHQEWCYVLNPAQGTEKWDYCKPIMDYDKIREENQDQLSQITNFMRKVENDLEQTISFGQEPLMNLKEVKRGQMELDTKVASLTADVSTLTNHMQNILNLKDQWEKVEEQCSTVASQITMKMNKLKEELGDVGLKKTDTSEEYFKREMQETKMTLNPNIQEKMISTTSNCEGMQSYEDEANGDGLMAQYYDNESFIGNYKEQKDPNIDFNWTGSSPMSGINPWNFSVKWEGYINIPVTSKYLFSIECDGGAAIFINNEPAVSHNMYSASSESKQRVEAWINEIINQIINPPKNFQKTTSEPIKLIGGSKYKISVSYYHSIHNDFHNGEKSFIKMYWESDEFEEQVVPRSALSSQNIFSPLKIGGVSPDDAVIRTLVENDLAFKNNDKYIIQDIPNDLRGSTCLKLNSIYTNSELNFTTNVPVIVYVGYFSHFPNPVPSNFENTSQSMSVLLTDTPVPNSNKIPVLRSSLVKLYKKKFEAGNVNIKLNKSGINSKGMPLIVFYTFDSSTITPLSCAGKEQNVADINSQYYNGCESSTYLSDSWKCESGLNSKLLDRSGSMWASLGEGRGAWIQINFKGLIEVTQINFMNRSNPAERNKSFTVTFSDGTQHTFNLLNKDNFQNFPLSPPVKTSSVRITITDVYSTINNGGKVQILGNPCINPDVLPTPAKSGFSLFESIKRDINKISFDFGIESLINTNKIMSFPSLFETENDRVVSLTCKDSFANSSKLDFVKPSEGNSLMVLCPESCAHDTGHIYGVDIYSKDSIICKAAYHSQKLKASGGKVKVIFKSRLGNYKGVVQSGVKSRNKDGSDYSISFELADELDEIILQTGSKVDFLNPDNPGTYLPAVIVQVKESSNGKNIELTVEGGEGMTSPYIVNYPDRIKVFPCGDKIPGRDCKKSRRNPLTKTAFKIKFAPSTYTKTGDYVLDSGLIFGSSGQAFGWSQDISNRMRLRVGAPTPELETLVEFPPSQKSKFCQTPSPDVLCDPVTWSIKVGFGKFHVKIFVGDLLGNTRLDLKINGKYLVKETTIGKGKLEIYEGIFDSINESLIIASECIHNCDYQMSKLNMIEIEPFKEKVESKTNPEPTKERQDPCKNAISGGKCDTGKDITNCLFVDPTVESAKYCNGSLIMMQVPKNYSCPSQRGLYKCVNKRYTDQNDCLKYCPNKCHLGFCTN